MVGGLGGGGKARRGYGPSGHLARPSSVGDFNEMEEDGWSINQMPDHEVPAEFEKMLENMNLSDVSCFLSRTRLLHYCHQLSSMSNASFMK